ncbi:MAG: hypothetical protein ACK56W_10535, partial [Pirellula sp.]
MKRSNESVHFGELAMRWILRALLGNKHSLFSLFSCFYSLVTAILLADASIAQEKQRGESAKLLAVGEGWSRWRGQLGDAHVSGLPKLWKEPRRVWRFELPANGIGGIAASMDTVVVSSRNANDTGDLFYLLDAESGI